MKKIFFKILIISFRLAVITGIIMLIPVGYEAWESFVEHKASTKGYKRSEGKVTVFPLLDCPMSTDHEFFIF